MNAVADIARSLNLTVVAEGIERQQELDWLTSLGCLVQGFLLGRPVDNERATVFLAKRQGRPDLIGAQPGSNPRPEIRV